MDRRSVCVQRLAADLVVRPLGAEIAWVTQKKESGYGTQELAG